MKHRLKYQYLIFAVFLLCGLNSCTKTGTSYQGLSVVKFNASFDQTKIVQDAEGKSLWEKGDTIDILYEGGRASAIADQSGATTTFTTKTPVPTDKTLYVAVYPSKSTTPGFDAELDDGEVVITLSNSSSASTFSQCAICKASTNKAGGDLVFKNICSMLKYSSSNKNITEASLYVDNATRYIKLTPNTESEDSTYYSTLALGYKSNGSVHIDNLGIRLTSRSKGVDYPAVYLHTNYYQNLNYCLHSGKSLSVVSQKHTVDNSAKVTAFNSASAKTKVVDGITAYYYTWNYTNTVSGITFAKPSKETVENAIKAVGESTTGAADGLGNLFLTWLNTVDENALTKDLIGTARPEGGICPGSVEQAQ